MTIPNQEIARQWRAHVVSPEPWRRCSNQTGAIGSRFPGEAGGYFAESNFLPDRRAYLKPTVPETGAHRWRAAREKIASDLAYDLGILVPPVLLWNRPPAGDEAEPVETRTCVSLVLNGKQLAWGTVEPLLEAGQLPANVKSLFTEALSECAAALAFDYWVGQPDHDHDSNIMFGYEIDRSSGALSGGYIFLDYAFALGCGGRWRGRKWETEFVVGFPERMRAAVDRTLLDAAITQIETYPDADLEDVVSRIPPSFLPESEQIHILQALQGRRHLVRSELQPILSRRP